MNMLFVFISSVTFVFWLFCKALYLSKISSNENFACTSLLKRDERGRLQTPTQTEPAS